MALGRTNINLTEIPIVYEQLVNYIIFYDSGDDCNEVHGGWLGTYKAQSSTNLVEMSKNADHIYFSYKGSYWKYRWLYTTNKIDFTDYVGLTLKGNATSNATYPHAAIGVVNGVSFNSSNLPMWTKVAEVKSGPFTVCDLSEITGELNVMFGCGKGDSTSQTGSMYVYEVFAYKADDYAKLASKAGITATSIDDILTDSSTLLSNEDAVNFMIAQCTGDFMVSAIQNTTFLTALNNSPYKSVVQSNEHWAKFLAMVA